MIWSSDYQSGSCIFLSPNNSSNEFLIKSLFFYANYLKAQQINSKSPWYFSKLFIIFTINSYNVSLSTTSDYDIKLYITNLNYNTFSFTLNKIISKSYF